MLLKVICSALSFIALMSPSLGSDQKPSDIETQRRMLGVLSRNLAPEEVFKDATSSVHSYKGDQGGVDVYCFWTQKEALAEEFKKAQEERLKAPGQPLSGAVEVTMNAEYTMPEAFSGKFFDVGPTDVYGKSKIVLHRACVYTFPDPATKQQELRRFANESFRSIEQINSLIALLEIMEKNSDGIKDEIKTLHARIDAELRELESHTQEPRAFRQIFVQHAGQNLECSSAMRSSLAFQQLVEALVSRDSFVPDHRIGEFLANLAETHRNVVQAKPTQTIVWVRNQLWNDGSSNNFHIEFRATSKQELCENYFSYSLPVFLHNVLQKWQDIGFGPIYSTASEKQIKNGLDKFKRELLPQLRRDCEFDKSLDVLEADINSVAKLDLSKQIVVLSSDQAKQLEWRLFRPDYPHEMPERHPIVETYFGEIGMKELIERRSAPVSAIVPGSIKFVTLKSPDELIDQLSTFVIKYYNLSTVCSFATAPVWNFRDNAGSYYDIFFNCLKEDRAGRLVPGSELYDSLTVAGIRGRNEYWRPDRSYQLIALRSFGDLTVAYANYSPFWRLKSRDPSSPHVYLLSSAVLRGSPSLISYKQAVSELLNNSKSESCNGKNYMSFFKANRDLSGCALRRVDLSKQNLSGAILTNADMEGANLISTNLIGANLQGTKLRGAVHNAVAENSYGFISGTRNTGHTLFPDSISSAIGVDKLVPYELCFWEYDKHCAKIQENPWDCIIERIGKSYVSTACSDYLLQNRR